MTTTIHDGTFVELTYKVTDRKSGHVLTCVEFPLGYVHGHNEILAPSIHKELEGKSAGDVIEVPIDGNRIFGPRDESLVFTDRIENVQEYRQSAPQPHENDKGRPQLPRDASTPRPDVDGNIRLRPGVVFRSRYDGARPTDEEMNAAERSAGPNVTVTHETGSLQPRR